MALQGTGKDVENKDAPPLKKQQQLNQKYTQDPIGTSTTSTHEDAPPVPVQQQPLGQQPPQQPLTKEELLLMQKSAQDGIASSYVSKNNVLCYTHICHIMMLKYSNY